MTVLARRSLVQAAQSGDVALFDCLSHGDILGATADMLISVLASFKATLLITTCALDELITAAVLAKSASTYFWRRVQLNRIRDSSSDAPECGVLLMTYFPSTRELRTLIVNTEKSGLVVEGVVALIGDANGAAIRFAQSLGYRSEIVVETSTVRDVDSAPTAPRSNGGHTESDDSKKAIAELRGRAVKLLLAGVNDVGTSYSGACVMARVAGDAAEIARSVNWQPMSTKGPDQTEVDQLVYDLWSGLATSPWIHVADIELEVHLFTSAERIKPSHIDWPGYGLAIRRQNTDTWGFVLPQEDGVTSEIEEFLLVLSRSRIEDQNAFELYRFRTITRMEHSSTASTSSQKQRRAGACEQIVQCLAQAIKSQMEPSFYLPAYLDDLPCAGIGVTLHFGGRIGCSTSWGRSVRQNIDRALQGAMQDRRLSEVTGTGLLPDALSATIMAPGRFYRGISANRFRTAFHLGADAISVAQGKRFAVFLEFVPPLYSWDRDTTLKALRAKATIEGGATTWGAYQADTAVYQRGAVQLLEQGYPKRQSLISRPKDYAASGIYLARLLGDYIVNRIEKDCTLPAYVSYPVTGERIRTGSLGRRLHAIYALAEAGDALRIFSYSDIAARVLVEAIGSLTWASRGAELEMDGDKAGITSLLELLRIATKCPSVAGGHTAMKPLAEYLASSLLQHDHRIAVPGHHSRMSEDHDLLPGYTIHVLADWCKTQCNESLVASLCESLNWYMRRFRQTKHWGMVGWLPHACRSLYENTGERWQADCAFEIVEWARDYQLETTGAFLTDLDRNAPSFHTGYIAESVAACWRLALRLALSDKIQLYSASWAAAIAFMKRLIIMQEDMYQMKDAGARGGVRLSTASSEVRIDYVSHTLLALVGGMRALADSSV